MNVLWKENYLRIWYPSIQFKNIDLSKSHTDRYLTYRVLRDLNVKPLVRNPGSTNATKVFKGSEHKIERLLEYTYYWRCVYNLKWYPFDLQTCHMHMRSPKHYHRFVRLFPEKVEFKGDKDELTKYSVDKILFCSKSNGTKLVLGVTLRRPLISSILTIYIPTLLLLVIRCRSWLKTIFFLVIMTRSPQLGRPSVCWRVPRPCRPSPPHRPSCSCVFVSPNQILG